MSLLITCENGGNRVPTFVADAFRSASAATDLASPLGYDLAALAAARELAAQTHAPLLVCPFSRLAIDVNHSLHHRQLYSRYTKRLPEAVRTRLIRNVYEPYRRQVHSTIEHLLQKSAYVVHLAVRTFPLQGRSGPRRTDIGLVYDPCREDERELCLDWHEELYFEVPWVRVRRNYPVRGRRDSLIKSLRERYSPAEYLGVEVHLNQAWAARATRIRQETFAGIGETLATILEIESMPSFGAA